MELNKVNRCLLTDGVALIAILLLGFVVSWLAHVPMALTWVQATAFAAVVAYPLYVLSQGKGAHKPKHVTKRQLVLSLVWFGKLAALIAYANYLFFFVRHGLSPTYIDVDHPFYLQATTLTLATIVLCQFINVLFVRADRRKQVFTERVWDNKNLNLAWLVSLTILTNAIYNPWLHGLFGAAVLDVVDWLTILSAATIYAGLRQLQRHTRLHTRHAIIKLHREVHKPS